MKKHICTFSLIIVTCATTVLAKDVAPPTPAPKPEVTKKAEKPKIEVCFVLDTTGSMGGLIAGAKEKIWSIANEMISAKPTPEIKIGLIGYRDKGDEYVTKVFNLTNDIDAVYANLQKFQAGGGGDTPESVNEALNDAVTKMSWSNDKKVLKIIFLVGDAPPHMDYDAPKYPEICKKAMKKDLIVNTVQCGGMSDTTPVWTEIAKLSEGNFVAIAQTGNMAAVATPVDGEIAALNREIGSTIVAWGGESTRREVAEAAAAPVAADRLSYKLKSAGKIVSDEKDIVNAFSDGKLDFAKVKKEELPEDLQKLSPEELKKYVETQKKKRDELQAKMVTLNKQRDDYIEAERKKASATGVTNSFDAKVTEAIRTQAARKGISYGSAPSK